MNEQMKAARVLALTLLIPRRPLVFCYLCSSFLSLPHVYFSLEAGYHLGVPTVVQT